MTTDIQEPKIENVRKLDNPQQATEILKKNAERKDAPAPAKDDAGAGKDKPTDKVDTPPAAPEKKDEVTPISKPEDKKPEEPAQPESKDKPEEADPVKPKEPKKRLRERLTPPDLSDKKKDAPEEPAPDVKSLQSQLEQATAQLEDPAVKAILNAKAKGQDVFELLDEIRGTNTNAMSDKDLYTMELKNLGYKSEKDPAFQEGDDSVESEMEKFKAMPAPMKKDVVEKIKARINEGNKEKMKDFYGKAMEPTDQDRQIQSFSQQLTELGAAVADKDIYGVKATKEMVTDVMTDIRDNGFIPLRKDGSFDEQKIFFSRFRDKYWDLILDNIDAEAYSNGVDEVSSEVEATPGAPVHDRPPHIQPKHEKGSEAEAQAYSEKLRKL